MFAVMLSFFFYWHSSSVVALTCNQFFVHVKSWPLHIRYIYCLCLPIPWLEIDFFTATVNIVTLLLFQYYRTAEGCKYGKSCRYWHHGEESQNIVPELNFLGLPIRSVMLHLIALTVVVSKIDHIAFAVAYLRFLFEANCILLLIREKKSAPSTCVMVPADMDLVAYLTTLILLQLQGWDLPTHQWMTNMKDS